MWCLGIKSCCCFDLRVGGLIIGYIQLIGTFLAFIQSLFIPLSAPNFTDDKRYTWICATIIELVLLLISVGWVYGIHKKRTVFMLPDLVLSVFVYYLNMAALVIIPILALVVPEIRKKAEGIVLLFVVIIFLGMFQVLVWFITSVKYSLYQQIKNPTYGRSGDQLGASV